MKSFCLAVFAAVVVLVAPELSAACATIDVNDFRTTYQGDINGDLNDYGRIFADSGDPACAENALYALTDKVNNHLNASTSTFTGWLDGYYVALIYGAALRLGEQGWASEGLDKALDYNPGFDTVASRFDHVLTTPPSGQCNRELFNTCMDDHAGSAAGFAWMAAYKAKRLNHNSMAIGGSVETARNKAKDHIQKSLASVCIRVKRTPGNETTLPVCDGTVSQLASGQAETLSVNGNLQIIHYGFGLMTSVLSAAQAYEMAGGGKFSFSTDEQIIAKGLYEEIKKHADQNGTYPLANCLGMSNGQIYTGARCDGVNAAGQNPSYLPNMYGLKTAYDYYFPGVITTVADYMSNNFDPNPSDSLFVTEAWADRYAHFGWGRYATYGIMARDWFQGSKPKMPDDNYDPTGYFEGISSTGLAQGWACDKDVQYQSPNRVKVSFFVDGWVRKAEGWANSSSETAINNICGGSAHRFWVQLPSDTKGKAVRAYANDFTWFGAPELPCLQSPSCSW
jgi:hypothetical protein